MIQPDLSLISIKQGIHKGWQSWQIHNGSLSLILVPQVGGRVMGMYWRGENLAFIQPAREGTVENISEVSDVFAKKQAMGFPLWGGEKTWLSPQSRWVAGLPFLDLDSGAYEFAIEQSDPYELTVRMTSPICRETGIQMTRRISMKGGSSEWTVSHSILNTSETMAEWGIWDVAMMLRPGRVYFPRYKDSMYPGGIKTFATEGNSIDLRNKVVHTLGTLAMIHCEQPEKFKFGVDRGGTISQSKETGWILGILERPRLGLVGYRKQVQIFPGSVYGRDTFAEVFNSDTYPYFEMETYGPLIKMNPGQQYTLKERHALFDVAKQPADEHEVMQLALGSLS